jgi:hypothetical protein
VEATQYVRAAPITEAQRDALTAANGMVIYNSTAAVFEMYQNGEWIATFSPVLRSYSFTSPAGSSGTFFIAGFYDASAADANLNEGSTTVTHGNANVPYAAHAFVVGGGAGAATGGSGAVTIVVSGTSITDAGVRTAGDSETIIADITAMATDQYSQTTKRWLGQITYTLTVGATGHTAYNADFNYGFARYDDYNNRDFKVVSFSAVGLAGANDAGFNIELLHHSSAGWTYDAASFVAGGSEIVDMGDTHSTENDLDNGVYFSFVKTGLTTAITGSSSQGIVIRITASANKAVEYMDAQVGVILT